MCLTNFTTGARVHCGSSPARDAIGDDAFYRSPEAASRVSGVLQRGHAAMCDPPTDLHRCTPMILCEDASALAIIARMQTPTPPSDIFMAWIRGWALTREVAPPVPHVDGFRIDVGIPRQVARYVFAQPSPTLGALGTSIATPWVFLKACATADELRSLLPLPWKLQPDGFMLVCGDAPFKGSTALPAGYTLHVDDDGARTRRAHVAVHAPDGALAASGHLALDDQRAIYDRIVTEPAHQRRGLGRAVMHALQALGHAHGRHAGVLVATPAGRALYESLGWRLHAPWATAVIPGPDAVD